MKFEYNVAAAAVLGCPRTLIIITGPSFLFLLFSVLLSASLFFAFQRANKTLDGTHLTLIYLCRPLFPLSLFCLCSLVAVVFLHFACLQVEKVVSCRLGRWLIEAVAEKRRRGRGASLFSLSLMMCRGWWCGTDWPDLWARLRRHQFSFSLLIFLLLNCRCRPHWMGCTSLILLTFTYFLFSSFPSGGNSAGMLVCSLLFSSVLFCSLLPPFFGHVLLS